MVIAMYRSICFIMDITLNGLRVLFFVVSCYIENKQNDATNDVYVYNGVDNTLYKYTYKYVYIIHLLFLYTQMIVRL